MLKPCINPTAHCVSISTKQSILMCQFFRVFRCWRILKDAMQVLAALTIVLPFHRMQSSPQKPSCSRYCKQNILEVWQSQPHTGAVQAAGGSNQLHQNALPDSCPHHPSKRSTSTMSQRIGAIDPLQFDTYTEGAPWLEGGRGCHPQATLKKC